MTWLAWRQQRVSILTVLGIIAVCAAVTAYIGIDLRAINAENGGACEGGACRPPSLSVSLAHLWPFLLLLLVLTVGALTGGPLFAREAEKGTHVLALTQSVSRIRWWATKLVLGLVPVVVAMLGLGLLNGWAMEPTYFSYGGPLLSPIFQTTGVALAAYTLFTFVVAAVIGSALKRTVGTVAITVGVFLVASLAAVAFRPMYAEPEQITKPYGDENLFIETPEGALVIEHAHIDANGNNVSDEVFECLRTGCNVVAEYSTVYYHPIERYWPFQASEAAALTVLTVVIAAGGVWIMRTRYSR